MSKRYYWLKLKNDFFQKKEIKRLRKMAGGDTYTIIYLKLLLLSLKEEGNLFFDGVGDDFADELSLELDEETDDTKMTLTYLQSKGLLEIVSDYNYHLNEIPEMIGSESSSAKRVRRHRKKKEERKALQSNGDVTNSNTEIELDIELDIDTEKEKEKNVNQKQKLLTLHYELSELLFKEIKNNNPNAKEPNYDSWANTFRLMIDRDKRTKQEIEEMIKFSQNHNFWFKNILSANTLRKQFDRLQLEKNGKNKSRKVGDF